MRRELEPLRKSLDFSVERVLTHDVESGVVAAVHEQSHSAQQRRLVLDAIETGHVNQPRRASITRARSGHRPAFEIDSQRNALRAGAERLYLLNDGRARRGHAIGAAQHAGFTQSAPPVQTASVGNLRQCHQFSTRHVHDTGQPEQPGCGHSDETGFSGPHRVNDLELRRAVRAQESCDRARGGRAVADVPHRHSGQLPARGPRFLAQREYPQVDSRGKIANETEQRGDHAVFTGAIDTAGNDESNLDG